MIVLFFKLFKNCFPAATHALNFTSSYTTSFPCDDGSYALIEGANMTLEYDFGFSHYKVRKRLSTIISQLSINIFFNMFANVIKRFFFQLKLSCVLDSCDKS